MSICIIGDPHFKKTNKKETDILVEDAINLVRERKPDFTVILGDVYDEAEYVYYGCILRVTRFIMELKALVPVYILVGNHDRPNNRVYLTDEHPFGDYKEIEGVTIIERCHTMEWRGKKICMMPYVQNNLFHRACQDCNINIMDYDLFFCHQEFRYCDTNLITGSECDEWNPKYPFNISGHIHKKQLIGHNLFYPGTPYQVNFNEDTDKGIYLMDENIEFEQFELRIPKKIEIKIDHRDIDSLLDVDQTSSLKITISGPREEIKKILDRSEYKEKLANATIHYKDTSKTRKLKSELILNTPFEDRLKQLLKNEKKRRLFREVFPHI